MADDSISGGGLLNMCKEGAYNLIEGVIDMAMKDMVRVLSGKDFKSHEQVNEDELRQFWDSEWCEYLMQGKTISWETAKAAAIRRNDYLSLRKRNGCTSNKRCSVTLCPHRQGKAIDMMEYVGGTTTMYCLKCGCMID